MVKLVAKKLKVVDVVENEAVEEKVEEVKTDAQEMTSIKEKIEYLEPPTEPVIMKPKRQAKAKAKAKMKAIEEIKEEIGEEQIVYIEETSSQKEDIEEAPKEISQKVKREKAKYMREYRKNIVR